MIGIPGLLLYLAAHALGISATIVPSGLPDVWWRIPVLILSAAMNATLEEVVVVGYLVTRLRQLGRSAPWAIGLAAVLRGSYHLYQGFGAFIGNAVMGVVFGWFFLRTRRVMPLIVAHTILDTVSFVGYARAGRARVLAALTGYYSSSAGRSRVPAAADAVAVAGQPAADLLRRAVRRVRLRGHLAARRGAADGAGHDHRLRAAAGEAGGRRAGGRRLGQPGRGGPAVVGGHLPGLAALAPLVALHEPLGLQVLEDRQPDVLGGAGRGRRQRALGAVAAAGRGAREPGATGGRPGPAARGARRAPGAGSR